MIQFFCGEGKGKTTAALGGAIRMAGAGNKILIAQFYKNGDSSEVSILKNIAWITYLDQSIKFDLYSEINSDDIIKSYLKTLDEIKSLHEKEKFSMIILDELGYIVNEDICNWITSIKDECEVVITGHSNEQMLYDIADYVTICHKEKHPFDKGVPARKGIEF